jgi:hypothetical protein
VHSAIKATTAVGTTAIATTKIKGITVKLSGNI